ncbi:type IX secretion system sortase PorU [Catalinimonas sp. 4WD22]|uniref:type IX secretion system sortase PorU n=1 Tax=Catalinimonas locisalis TaxID=3133978 RepID=UPI0031014593
MLQPYTFLFSFLLSIALLSSNLMLAQAQSGETQSGETRSVMSEGQWYKFAVTEKGIYKITARQLSEKGVDISQIDPSQLAVFGYGGGMLPQHLAEKRYADLPENAIYLAGTEDGEFNQDDYLIFYAQGPDQCQFEAGEDGNYRFHYEKNLYADTAYYFLSTTEGKGVSVENQPEVEQSAINSTISVFDDYWAYENDEFHVLQPGSGREWYGDRFSNGQTKNYAVDLDNISDKGEIVIQLSALGRSTTPSNFEVSVNNQPVSTLELPAIINATYTDKGKENSGLLKVSAESFVQNELVVGLRYKGSGGDAHLNSLLLSVPRKLSYESEQLHFRSIASVQKVYSRFLINSSNSNAQIWDVTSPLSPESVQANYEEGSWSFDAPTQDQLREFVIFNTEDLPQPLWIGLVENQALTEGEVPDLLIITPASLQAEAERLAAFRRQHDNMVVKVATTDQVYNRFSSGRQDISAIRNYAKALYDQEEGKLKYLLLFGKASYDYKKRVENNTNLVPTYQSRNSIHPIYSYPSDDYYAFMENDEGEWEESYRGDHTMDIGVGRLPVKNSNEAKAVVDKLINYASGENTLGDWRTRLAFLADDGDNDRYQKDSEQLTEAIYERYAGFNPQKIYLDAYAQERYPNQELAPEVNQAVEDVIKNGVLIFNYVGHGSELRLAEENVLNVGMISRWENQNKLPFFVTATCEFGRHDDPKRVSGAEELLLNPKGGAIGLVTTARPVFSNTNYLLNQAFYQHVFEQEDGQFLRLGDVFRKTKNDALNGRDNRNFSLLADPSMRLAYPFYQIEIDSAISLSEEKKIDTLKALSEVRFFGRVTDRQSNELIDDFGGELTLVLHDKPFSVNTKGNEGTVMQFKETNNVIHRGRASVRNGRFTIDFVVPKNIIYRTDLGRISLYAKPDNNNVTDAFGGGNNFFVGSSSDNITVDHTGPQIALYLDDSSFVSGAISGSTPHLLARLWDEQGINLSKQQTGQEITAGLYKNDGTLMANYVLNDFYESDVDTYESGIINYPLGHLEEGKYVLTLQAWDTHNNSNTSSVEFDVSDAEALSVRSFYNYPNPFSQSTLFVLDHNRAGDDLIIKLQIFDSNGKQVKELEKRYENSTSRIDLLDWSLGNQNMHTLTPGIYIVKLNVRSLSDQQEVEENLKIILTN